MKNQVKLFALALAVGLSVSSMSVYAGSDKTFDKAKSAVENASPDDWKTYAESAQKLIKKKANLAEAKTWIEKSISIRETAFNLEVLGDYYVKNNLPKEAVSYYVKSMNKMREETPGVNVTRIQQKILDTSKMK